MRPRWILLAGVVVLVVLHVLGLLTAVPIFRPAELVALSVLVVYALLMGAPAHRWAVPLAFVAPVVDAYRTMPADPSDGRQWQVFRPGPLDLDIAFDTGLRATWASLVVVLVLTLVVLRGRERPGRRVVAGAAAAAAVVTGYVVVLVVRVHLAGRDTESRRIGDDGWAGTEISAASAPFLLALAAIGLAALLLGRGRSSPAGWGGRRLAVAGAVLLVPAALLHLDATLGMLPLPYPSGDGIFLTAGITAGPTLAAPVPALTAAVELTAYLLLAAGLTTPRSPASD
ncbi:hypothetical protein ACIBO1_01730 [Micromonospora sp. NPDC049903]|uniref:hypothetical protein n=1 Tax=Micromonospora sp. NPDC049903 TaxID=3364276 RepID=UPI0037A60134